MKSSSSTTQLASMAKSKPQHYPGRGVIVSGAADQNTSSSSFLSLPSVSRPSNKVISTASQTLAPQAVSKVKVSLAKSLSAGSASSSGDLDSTVELMAAERWQTLKLNRELDNGINDFYGSQLKYAKKIRNTSNKRAVDLFEKLLYILRWANPPVVTGHQNVIIDYCKHLLSDTPAADFASLGLLDAFYENSLGSVAEKSTRDLRKLYLGIRDIVITRDITLQETKASTLATVDKLTIKKEGKLRWQMETTHGQRDTFWTIWYLSAQSGMNAELERYLTNPEHQHEVNLRDPDHGLTPLHYACKRGDMVTFNLLRRFDADIHCLGPDGRSPLHFAAMYGSRAVVLELLALGADYHGKDCYGCIPLELANQNKNKGTFKALANWYQLVPQDSIDHNVTTAAGTGITTAVDDANKATDISNSDIDLHNIPNEYWATPEDVIESMSRILRVHTRRLCPLGPHGYGFVKEPFLEMRLCEKHAYLSFEEGFSYDGYKSLRRRWRIAKSVLAMSRDDLCVVHEYHQPKQDHADAPSNVVVDNRNELNAPSAVNIVHEDLKPSTEEAQLPNIQEAKVTLPSAKGEEGDDVRPLDLESLLANEMKNSPSAYQRPARRDPRAVGAGSMDMESLRLLSFEERMAAITKDSYIPESHVAKSIEVEDVARRGKQNGRIEDIDAARAVGSRMFNTCAVLDIGFDLAERCIKDRQEGFAVVVLEECIAVSSRLAPCATKIAVYSRLAEVLVYLHDYLDYTSRGKLPEYWQARLQLQAKSRDEFNEVKGGKYMTGTLVIPSTSSSSSTASSSAAGSYTSSYYNEVTGGHSSRPVTSPAVSLIASDFAKEAGQEPFSSQLQETIDTETTQRSIPAAAVEEHRLKMLFRARVVIEEAIAMNEYLFQGDVVEPAIHGSLLEIQSDVYERGGDNGRAYDIMRHVEAIYQRSLGFQHEDTERVGLQVMRINMKCTSVEGFKLVSLKVRELTQPVK